MKSIRTDLLVFEPAASLYVYLLVRPESIYRLCMSAPALEQQCRLVQANHEDFGRMMSIPIHWWLSQTGYPSNSP